MLVFATAVLGEGAYQHTQDNKTIVWNDNPKAGDSATWDGARDDEGYADGFGTLTWYSGDKVYARFYGNMVHGKFDGPVNAHSNDETAHAIFIHGKLATSWRRGRAPSQQAIAERVDKVRARVTKKEAAKPAPAHIEVTKEKEATPSSSPPTVAKAKSTKAATPQPAVANHPEMPADGPPAEARPKPALPLMQAPQPAIAAPRNAGVDKSLAILARPPSSLRSDSINETPAENPSRLSKENAVDLADAQVQSAGYDLANYDRPKTEFNASNGNWSVSYDRESAGAAPKIPGRLTVTVDDKTKKTVVVPSR